MRDELFKKEYKKQFEFDKNVASVFDDMIHRSVPFYKENLELCANFVAKFCKKNSKICDLGCSSANFLIRLYELRKDLVLSGVDESLYMLDLAKSKSKALGVEIEFFENSFEEFEFFMNDVFVANYTLQFVRPLKRQSLIGQIYKHLNEGGFFIMSEKILDEDKEFATKMIELYSDFKQKQGYSEFEIAKKREALENVLIPYSEKENLAMLETAGFKKIKSIFKWVNFQSFIAFK